MGGTKKKTKTKTKLNTKTKNKQTKTLTPLLFTWGLTMHLQNTSDTLGFEEFWLLEDCYASVHVHIHVYTQN